MRSPVIRKSPSKRNVVIAWLPNRRAAKSPAIQPLRRMLKEIGDSTALLAVQGIPAGRKCLKL